ncbi:MAG: carbon-nitrogen hydrolase family protein [Rhodospirillales bacterium]|jgi:predicted amidohydrolase|nr:carbon-nitrogen hydrolase family protein [Rhodospirillales bacterium]MDP6883707.1 carbon-nitrogen hydrolase family protein [Rhodospirillales bacterium]
MGRQITIAVAQTGPVLGEDMRPGAEAACAMIEQAAGQGVEIVCFPEVFLTPFFPAQLRADYEQFFIELPNPVTDLFLDLAREKGIGVIFGFGERAGSYLYNSAAIFDRGGRHVGTYRKAHLPAILPSNRKGGTGSYEKMYFSPGGELPVYEMDGLRFGIQICYERKFPEASRALALKGAEIIFMPICAATYGESTLRDQTWALPLQCRAYENGVFVAAANRCGDEKGRRHIGQSMIVNPVGADIMIQGDRDEPALLAATLDLDDTAAAQKSLPWWRDRRPDLYGGLAEQ